MLTIVHRDLPQAAKTVLDELHHLVISEQSYEQRIALAKKLWVSRTSNRARSDAFSSIKFTLRQMCVGPMRCGYCEDSLADEIEHVKPKSLFPELAFSWDNYIYSCGPCNGPKSNRFAVISNNELIEFTRRKNDPLVPPPLGMSALINPRSEDPMAFLELDLGGTTPDGEFLDATFNFFPKEDSEEINKARANFTIDVLGLNREVLRISRENAFGGFRARLSEYVSEKMNDNRQDILNYLKYDLLSTPHLTVFCEMRRQKKFHPQIEWLFSNAPEAEAWQILT